MIGQTELRESLKRLIDADNFPRFSIFVGSKGSGRHTLVRELDAFFPLVERWEYVECGIGIDDVRKAIDQAYRSRNNMIYCFPDADKMSVAAKNAMLKVIEEPPNNAVFIMTLEDVENTLATVRSRASIFRMQPYSQEELRKYWNDKYGKGTEEYVQLILSLAETPGEVDMLEQADGEGKADKFYDYVTLVVDNIAEVQPSNSFKIADKVALKEGAEGYDLRLFLKAFMSICLSRMEVEPKLYASGISITSKYLQQMSIKGVSKSMLLDSWILAIRKEWM